MTPGNHLKGIYQIGDGSHPVDIWQAVHAGAKAWHNVTDGPHQKHDRLMIDGSDINMMRWLANFPAERWANLCHATGMTVYGAVALSWCKDAKLEDVWAGWEASGFPLVPLSEYERPARFINPALMAPLNNLGDILNAEKGKHTREETYLLAICARVVAADDLVFDVKDETLRQAHPQIAAFLKSRMERLPNRTAEQNALIEAWTQSIKGTNYDIGTIA